MSDDRVASASRRRWKLAILLAVAVCLLLVAAASIRGAIVPTIRTNRLTHTVTRGDLIVTVTEQGTVESTHNTEVKCRVRGGYGGRGGESTVTWVIPAGTVVSKGDELIRLDTKVIEETISLGKTDTNNAKAELARAEAELAKAEVAVGAYLEGTYRQRMHSLEMEQAIAQRNVRTSKTILDRAGLLFKQGHINKLELEGHGYAVTQAALELNVKETRIDVLSRLTKAMELETLNGQLTATKARVEGRTAGVALEQGRLDLALDEFENCVIRAPADGLVIYPSTAKWKNAPDVTVGASVHNHQTLLLMPDLSRMQVKVGVHESIVHRIEAGMAVNVTLPSKTIQTQITSVASVASPAGWWSGNEVTYEVLTQLPAEAGLKPGMSADVELVVARYQDVVSVPTAAVLDTDQGQFCWVLTNGEIQRRSLGLGDSNDDFVVLESGLTEGDVVVLDPLVSVAEAQAMATPNPIHTVGRGDLRVTLTEQGTLESSNNTYIKCRVRGNSTVNWVVESGTEVKAGDELIRLENKQIEEYLYERTKFAALSKDASIGFRAHATRAGLAISEYVEGRYRTELMTLEKDLAIAEERLGSAKNMLDHARRMGERGYVSQLDVQQKQFAVRQAEMDVELKQTEIDVLQRFTKREELTRLRGDWEAAKAAAAGHEEVLRMDEARIALAQKEMERCVITADRAGLVIFPSGDNWDDVPDIAEGATVHHDQVLLLMPDLSKMQVKVGIHESIVERIQPGMTAKVTLPNGTLSGEVSSVASSAQPSGWWNGNVVKYDTIIQLPTAEGLKPGMSAEVEIMMVSHENVLMLPLSTIVESEDGLSCWVQAKGGTEKRLVQVGESDEMFVEVKSGLEEGEQVVLNPARSTD